MKVFTYLILIFLTIPISWARCAATKISINTQSIQYHARTKPNALICRYITGAKGELLKKSRETWIHPDSAGTYHFHYPPHHLNFESTQSIRQNMLECDVRGITTPGSLISFVCYNVLPHTSFVVLDGFLNGNCVPHYL